ncbi:MAG: sigma-70 family RNA polymerase sigma factor [Solirubrobacteraceae bacterium]|nr:sigma-70 family RNA polymerase sigma factor [Solirubrobacteraceae bacterium]
MYSWCSSNNQTRPIMDISDPTIYTKIYEQHRRGVFAAAFRILGNEAQADDVAQDVFIKVWRKPASFDSKRGELGSYLRLMARSRALDLWREGQAAGRASDRLKNVVIVGASNGDDRPDQVLERSEATDTVVSALRTLPANQREAVVLAYWGGLTAEEVARRAAVPLGTAKSRIRLGLTKLRDEFGEGYLAANAA